MLQYVVCAARIEALREFWTDWLPTETPFFLTTKRSRYSISRLGGTALVFQYELCLPGRAVPRRTPRVPKQLEVQTRPFVSTTSTSPASVVYVGGALIKQYPWSTILLAFKRSLTLVFNKPSPSALLYLSLNVSVFSQRRF